MSVAAATIARVQELVKLRANLLGQSYNPLNVRTGNKILRQRLRGPAFASYYPPRAVTIKDLERMFPGLETFDEQESDRWDSLALKTARGKGKPKKKRTAEESKKFSKRKPAGAAAPK